MALTPDSIIRIGSRGWQFDYTGTAPFAIYLDGVLRVSGVAETSINIEHQGLEGSPDNEEPPALEIVDAVDTTDVQTLVNPAVTVLQWRGVTDADFYKVEKDNGSGFVQISHAIEEQGRGYYQYESRALPDVTTHNYRVIAVEEITNGTDKQSTPVAFDIFISRNPPVPRISIDYNEANLELDVTARA